ncbi:MAG: GNAT family N-acetyltransferase [Saprospiraceae bacterium]
MQITTERLILRPLALIHAPFILELVNTEGWLRNIGDRKVHTIIEAEQYLEKNYIAHSRKYDYGFCAVHLKSDDTPIGTCGLMTRDSLPGTDIGFAFLPAFHGKGYALEAAIAVMEYAEETLQLDKVLAITVEHNTPSRSLLEKLGLRFKEVIYLANDGEPLYLYEKSLQKES